MDDPFQLYNSCEWYKINGKMQQQKTNHELGIHQFATFGSESHEFVHSAHWLNK